MGKAEIRDLLLYAKQREARHMMLVTKVDKHVDVPVLTFSEQDLETCLEHFTLTEGYVVLEVYSLTGKYDLEEQLAELIAFHVD